MVPSRLILSPLSLLWHRTLLKSNLSTPLKHTLRMTTEYWTLCAAVAVGLVLVTRNVASERRRNPRRLPLPPGPRGLPIIGNVMDIPKEHPWIGYNELCKKYGDLVSLNALGMQFLVVGNLRRALDLLDKRAVNYSDRPALAVLELTKNSEWNFSLMPYNSRWRLLRKTFHGFFSPGLIAQYHPVMHEEIHRCLGRLRDKPQGFMEHVRLLFGTIIMRTSYGFDDIGRNEALIKSAEHVVEEVGEAIKPTKFLVNIFPSLRYVPAWFPGAGWKRHLNWVAELSEQTRWQPFDNAKASTNRNYASIAASLIDALPDESESTLKWKEAEAIGRDVSAMTYVAGADSTVSSATSLILALANNPGIQRKAHAELDSVVGAERIPDINDRPALPYVQAIVKEAARWCTVVPMCAPHSSVEDDEYNGYFIPKGTVIMPNVWCVVPARTNLCKHYTDATVTLRAIMHDPETFEDPFEFKPERYLKDGEIDPSVPDAELAAFGFGRRICPGRHFSNDALFLFTASLLSTFLIEPPKDEAGNFIPLELKLSSHTVWYVSLQLIAGARLTTNAVSQQTLTLRVYDTSSSRPFAPSVLSMDLLLILATVRRYRPIAFPEIVKVRRLGAVRHNAPVQGSDEAHGSVYMLLSRLLARQHEARARRQSSPSREDHPYGILPKSPYQALALLPRRGLRMPTDYWTIIGVITTGIGVVLAARNVTAGRGRNPRRLSLPPGPRGLPIVGNILQIPQDQPWVGYDELCRKYGDMVHLNALGMQILVVGTLRRALDLLDKRAANYSDRPSLAVLEITKNSEWNFSLMPYGSRWRLLRRTFHSFLSPSLIAQYHPIMHEEIHRFLGKLRDKPQDFMDHIRLVFGTIIMRTAYGFDDIGRNEALIKNAEHVVEEVGESIKPTKFLVNIFPALRYVPSWFLGAGWKRHLNWVAELSEQMRWQPFDDAKANTNRNYPSISASLIDSLPDEGGSILKRREAEAIARDVTAMAYIAGADTTVSSATALFLALANHPEVQRKAHSEIEAVVGTDRLPGIADRPALPYVHAIVKEIGRWFTVLPMGGPHSSVEDDEYEGYFIPKGTVVMPNIWAIMHDPDTFDDPFEFKPDRYMKDGQIDPSVPDAEIAAFGFGRRICPGRHFSHDTFFLLTAALLSTFTIDPPEDEAGNPVPLELKVSSHTVWCVALKSASEHPLSWLMDTIPSS
ncbi:hypothetical protein NMY22_g10111 [Coprinellus aureogranulatus]|nr:hypothetical protein NMY22_g10111 [Coprinellus aureogranulatus]